MLSSGLRLKAPFAFVYSREEAKLAVDRTIKSCHIEIYTTLNYDHHLTNSRECIMILQSYSPPAFINDFPNSAREYSYLAQLWNINVDGWIQQAMPPDPSFFYNPLETDIPSTAVAAVVNWVAFPGRLDQFYSANPPVPPTTPKPLTQDQIYSLADTGYTDRTRSSSFPQIPAMLCPQARWNGSLKTFGPYGPRGWLDEYCEWSVARDANGNMTRVDFACENPEYWNTVWRVNPDRVRELYEQTLNYGVPSGRAISVKLTDLQLLGPNGQPVIDPQTGRPAYNPLNKWNSGPVAVRVGAQSAFSGGAMHLTSTPNTLQTELGLAGAATVQYQPPGGSGNSDPQALICCGNYGQEYRHSDPHIGQVVNQVVGGQALGYATRVCLANPVGLYIQLPESPSAFTFGPKIVPGKTVPASAKPIDIWQVVRGSAQLTDPVTNQPFQGNFILHVAAQIPQSWLRMTSDLTLADILINGRPIVWAGQIANQFKIGLFARPLKASSSPPKAPCASPDSPPGVPLQAMYAVLWDAYYAINEPAPTGAALSLASNTTMIAPQLPSSGAVQQLVLTCTNFTGQPDVQVQLPDGSGPDPKIKVTVMKSSPVTYAVPGNSYPGNYTALYLFVLVPAQLPGGLRGIQITVGGATQSLPAAVYILAAP
jgi:hypothetical protein